MNFCCGVTLYYPSEEELNAIIKYKDIFEVVYLFDNTDSNERLDNEKYFYNDDRIIYISTKENEGLSVAYNNMCQKAISHGFDYICLLDQDSLINTNDLIKMIDYIKIYNRTDAALYVPEVIYKHENNYMKSVEDKCIGVEIDWAISSGSFINLLSYQKTEGFDENYFIDRLDYDYCITVRKLGYKVIKIKNAFLYQTLGEQGNGIFKNVSQHSPIRHYYIFRNRFYFYIDKSRISNIQYLKLIIVSLRHFIKIILFETCKIEKLKMMYRAWKDYQRGKMGKFISG